MRLPAPILALAVAVTLPACSQSARAGAGATFSPRPIVIVTTPPSKTGPYVVVAVDNHFHDIHPSDPPTLSATRPFLVKNEGFNLHNFTVLGTDISIDIPPGGTLAWAHIGDHLKPGTYTVVCKYHESVGMVGKFFVTK